MYLARKYPWQWFSFSSRDLKKIADGIGHKFALFLYGVSGFLCGYIMGFIYGWKLTLVMMSLFRLMAASGGFLGWVRF